MPAASGDTPNQLGRYVLHHSIASGGMATVYLARMAGTAGFSRMVAIKRLHPQFARDAEFVRMFTDEARLAGRIHHPNVVPTLDIVASDDELFLVMDYVHGVALSRLVREVRTRKVLVPAPIAVSLISATLHGLHAAHEATDEEGRPLDIVHRDVSPQNILVGADGVPRVLDFGVAKAVGRLQSTAEGQFKGKVAYMAPEQLEVGPIDRRADVYAAAVVLWEALTTRRLFEGESGPAVMRQVLEAKVQAPSLARGGGDVSPQLDAIVLRGLTRDRRRRYATAQEMALALERCMGIVSPAEIGQWVAEMGGAELSARSMHMKEMQSDSVRSAVREAPPESVPEPPGSASEIASVHLAPVLPSAPATTRLGVAVAALVGAVVLGAGVASLVVAKSCRTETSQAGSSPSPSANPSATASETPSAEPTRDVSASAPTTSPSASASASVAAAPAHPPPPGRARSSGASPPATTQTKPAPSPPHPDCDPPFTLDAAGHKIYKRECL